MKIIYFIFSSISFLQYYIPLVIEAKSRKYTPVFITRNNCKKYISIEKKDNYKLLKKYSKIYGFKLIKFEDFNDIINTFVFMIDGDIYGPGDKHCSESLLFKLKFGKDALKISLTENINYKWIFHKCINQLDYFIFPNINYCIEDDIVHKKNLYLGNCKYDNILSTDMIYQKFDLNKSNKYILLLYPKNLYIRRDDSFITNLEDLYSFLHKIGYKIIVKFRPKDYISNDISDNLKGDRIVISEIYPNETIELLKISDLCIFFSSSAIEECIMMKTPIINFNIDFRNVKRLTFLQDQHIYLEYNKISEINEQDITILTKYKGSDHFNKIIDKYLFDNTINSSVKIFNYFNIN